VAASSGSGSSGGNALGAQAHGNRDCDLRRGYGQDAGSSTANEGASTFVSVGELDPERRRLQPLLPGRP